MTPTSGSPLSSNLFPEPRLPERSASPSRIKALTPSESTPQHITAEKSEKAFQELREQPSAEEILQRQALVENGLVPRDPAGCGTPENIVQRMQELGVPAVSITVINNGQVEWSKSYGDPQESSKLFQAASISKIITALTVLSLIDQGTRLSDQSLLTLDTDVSKILGEELWRSIDPEGLTKNPAHKVTIARLLSHSAGINVSGFDGYPRSTVSVEAKIQKLKAEKQALLDDGKDTVAVKQKEEQLQFAEAELFRAQSHTLPTTDEILRGQNTNSPPVRVGTTPGLHFDYSGGGMMILQKVVELITNKLWDQVVEKQVFTRLGMDRSTFYPEETRTLSGTSPDGKPLPGGWNAYPELAAAGMWTTSRELAEVLLTIQQSLAGNKAGLLSQEMAKKMLTPQTDPFNGLGIYVDKLPKITLFSHPGGNEGFRCMLVSSATKGAVIMTNSDNGGSLLKEILPSIVRAYNWQDWDILPMCAPLVNPGEVEPVDPAAWFAQYAGRYCYQDGNETHYVLVSKEDGKILVTFDNDPPFTVIPCGKAIGSYQRYTPGPKDVIRFSKDAQGRDLLELFGRNHTKVG